MIGQPAPDKARSRGFYYALIFIAAISGISCSIYFHHTILSIITAFTLLFCAAIFFKYIAFSSFWNHIAHVMLIGATLVNFSNAFLDMQEINLINIQLILIAILFSFYMLGKEWGLFYSLLNLAPTLIFIILEYNNNYFDALKSGRVDLYQLIVSLIIDAVIIAVIQISYYKPFFRSFMQNKESNNEEIDLDKIMELTFKNDETLSEVTSEFTKTFAAGNKLHQVSEKDGSLRVLIAEDNPVNVMIIKKVLAKWDINPTIAENGEQVLELLKCGSFDIVLMDIQMPVLNGFDAAKEIRNLPDAKKAGIPIIAVTTAALTSIRDQVINSGMNDYLPKPFKADDLMAKIHRLVAFS
ncbi:MAG: response regulator [Bacteroidota bacterium]|nr:response regulator [Bacteroidota bacterium]